MAGQRQGRLLEGAPLCRPCHYPSAAAYYAPESFEVAFCSTEPRRCRLLWNRISCISLLALVALGAFFLSPSWYISSLMTITPGTPRAPAPTFSPPGLTGIPPMHPNVPPSAPHIPPQYAGPEGEPPSAAGADPGKGLKDDMLELEKLLADSEALVSMDPKAEIKKKQAEARAQSAHRRREKVRVVAPPRKKMSFEENIRLLQEFHDYYKWELVLNDMRVELGRTPTPQEWEEQSGITVNDFLALRQKGLNSKGQVLQLNMGLVYTVASKVYSQFKDQFPLEKENLVHAATLGLARAAEKFDASKGFRFSTYAIWWIRSAIKRELHAAKYVVHIPEYRVRQLARIMRIGGELKKSLRRMPTDEEIAREAEVKVAMVEEAYTLYKLKHQNVIDGDQYMFSKSGDSRTRMIDTVVLDDDEHEVAQDVFVLEDILAKTLTRDELMVFRLKFGLSEEYAGASFSLKAIAEELGMAPTRVNKLAQSAESKLLKSKRLRKFAEEQGVLFDEMFNFAFDKDKEKEAEMDEDQEESKKKEEDEELETEVEMDETLDFDEALALEMEMPF